MKDYQVKVINNFDKKTSAELERLGRDIDEALTEYFMNASDITMFNWRISNFVELDCVEEVCVCKDAAGYTWSISYKENGYSYNTVIHAVEIEDHAPSMIDTMSANLNWITAAIIGHPETKDWKNGKHEC